MPDYLQRTQKTGKPENRRPEEELIARGLTAFLPASGGEPKNKCGWR